MAGHLTIVSCGLGPDDLTARHRRAVARADVLAGGERLLAWFPEFAGEKEPIGAHVEPTVDRLTRMAEQRRVAVLASGDALFFGIARLFVERARPDALTIIPNVTAAQAALARLHVAWESARFFSVHGRSSGLPWRAVLRAPPAVVYADSLRHPPQVAADLIDAHPASGARRAAIVEALGSADERLREGTLSELARLDGKGMSMLILFPPDAATAGTVPEIPLGLDDEHYLREGDLITHPELRAVALSKLRLRPGVLWDLGAGTGSVSIEAAGLCEGIRVCAVEVRPERCEHIRHNAARAGCPDYQVIESDILLALEPLPSPDMVFVGGGGAAIAPIVDKAYAALRPGGTLVAASVLEETRSQLLSVLPDVRRESCEIAVRRAAPLGKGTMMRPSNPVTLFVFRKPNL